MEDYRFSLMERIWLAKHGEIFYYTSTTESSGFMMLETVFFLCSVVLINLEIMKIKQFLCLF